MAKMEIEYVFVTCATASCGMEICLTSGFNARAKKNHREFYCPNGHVNYYPQKSDEEILRDRLKEKEREIEQVKRSAAEEMIRIKKECARKRRARKKKK